MRPPISRSTVWQWAGALAAGLRQGLCGPALQLAMQAQLPALALGWAQDRPADGAAGAARVASLKGVQA